MDLFAYTAVEKDICPLALLSAMAAGLPIATFDIEGVRAAIVTEEHGVLVPAGQVEPLAHALRRLIVDDGLCRRLGRNARARVEDQFNLGQYVRRMEEILHGVTEPHYPTRGVEQHA